jgi:hypothetical protein
MGHPLQLRDPGLQYLKIDPLVDPLRREPRFQAIERELKFPSDAILTRSSRSLERIVALSVLWKFKRSRQMTAVVKDCPTPAPHLDGPGYPRARGQASDNP